MKLGDVPYQSGAYAAVRLFPDHVDHFVAVRHGGWRVGRKIATGVERRVENGAMKARIIERPARLIPLADPCENFDLVRTRQRLGNDPFATCDSEIFFHGASSGIRHLDSPRVLARKAKAFDPHAAVGRRLHPVGGSAPDPAKCPRRARRALSHRRRLPRPLHDAFVAKEAAQHERGKHLRAPGAAAPTVRMTSSGKPQRERH